MQRVGGRAVKRTDTVCSRKNGLCEGRQAAGQGPGGRRVGEGAQPMHRAAG